MCLQFIGDEESGDADWDKVEPALDSDDTEETHNDSTSSDT